jgi:hypothetical protein
LYALGTRNARGVFGKWNAGEQTGFKRWNKPGQTGVGFSGREFAAGLRIDAMDLAQPLS